MSAGQVTEVDAILQQGYRTFLFHDFGDGPWRWSFLYKWSTLAISVAGGYDYTMDDDFGGLDGPIKYTTDVSGFNIEETNPHRIAELRQNSNSTGRPYLYALRARSSDQSAGQKFELIFYPTPDASYTLVLPQMVLVNKLSASYPYPLGGMSVSQAVLECCLWQAELKYYQQVDGPHAIAAQLALKQARNNDLRNTPSTLGYMGDNSDNKYRRQLNRSVEVYGTVPS